MTSAGWYPEPGSGRLRYFDGQGWGPYAPEYPPTPPAPYPAAALRTAGTNGMAIASLVLGILGVSVLAIIFGHISLAQLRTTREQGQGMAVAGLILGYLGLAITLLVIVIFVAAVGSVSST